MAVSVKALVMVGAGGGGTATTSVNTAAPVPPEFVALMFTWKLPATVGVPEMRPLDVLTDRPVGSPVAP